MYRVKLIALWLAVATTGTILFTSLPSNPVPLAEWGGLAEAQQPVNLTRINSAVPIYDPCLDPSKVVAAQINAAAASTTITLVAISGVTRIYLCSAKFQSSAAGIFTLQFGNNADCTSFTTSLDATLIATNGDGALITNGGTGTFARSLASQAMCLARSASMAAYGHIRYVQE